MATDALSTGDHVLSLPQRRAIERSMREYKISKPMMATALRISRGHFYSMMAGRHPMPYYYALAIKQVLLEARLGR